MPPFQYSDSYEALKRQYIEAVKSETENSKPSSIDHLKQAAIDINPDDLEVVL